jgi:hypothetical protein
MQVLLLLLFLSAHASLAQACSCCLAQALVAPLFFFAYERYIKDVVFSLMLDPDDGIKSSRLVGIVCLFFLELNNT